MTRSGKFYRKNEKEVMAKLGLKGTPGSGAFWLDKEDGQSDEIIAQLKSTDAASIKVSLDDINKLEYNAIVSHKIPIFIIQFLQHDEVFILVKPGNLPDIAQYLECGCLNPSNVETIDETISNVVQSSVEERKTITSKLTNKNKFWKQKEKERIERKWQK